MNEKVVEEGEFGLMPRHVSVAAGQVIQPSLEIRKLGFSTLINAKPGQDGYEELFENDIFQAITNSFSEDNLPIIGMVCAAFRNLSFYNPELADDYVENIPIPFLLKLKQNTEIIDFFSTLVLNSIGDSDNFATRLLSTEQFVSVLVDWLESGDENIIKSSLDLLNSLSIYNKKCFDFSIVTHYADEPFSTDIRSLALNILYQINPSKSLVAQIILLLQEDDLGQTYFEIVHDICQNSFDEFSDCFDLLLDKCIANFRLPPAALILSIMGTRMNDEQAQRVIENYFSYDHPSQEQSFAIHQIASVHSSLINEEHIIRLANVYVRTRNIEEMEILEQIFLLYQDIASTETIQQYYLLLFDLDEEYCIQGIRFIQQIMQENSMIPELLSKIDEYSKTHSSALEHMQYEPDIIVATP